MGALTSSIFSEIYLQDIENTKITELLVKHKIKGYFRYIDDILIMYKEEQTNISSVLDDFNSVIPSMKFTLEKEENNKINFLDITITKGHDGLPFEIYWKLTTTDVVIPNDSCHSREHKTAAIRYFYNRMKTYKLTPESKQKERNTVQQILVNNNYEASTLGKFSKEKKQKQDTQKRKWAKFTYIRKETRFIAKLFKNTDVKVTSTTDNTIERHLAMKHGTDQSKYNKSSIYQLTCPDCKMKYTGQTGRPFKIRFQEHLRDFKYGNNKSKFAQHLLENKHGFGPMEEITDIVHITNKGEMMDTLERYYINEETKSNNQINDKLTIKPNAIFETVINEAPCRGHSNA
jgi:hypothetical protein